MNNKDDMLNGASVTIEINEDHSNITIYSKNKELTVDSELETLFLKRIEKNIEKLGKTVSRIKLASFVLSLLGIAIMLLLKRAVRIVLLSSYITMHFLYIFSRYRIYRPKDIAKNKFALSSLLIGSASAIMTCILLGSDAAIREGIISLVSALVGILFAITISKTDDIISRSKMVIKMNKHMLMHPINITIKNEDFSGNSKYTYK
nr:hypothetical protein [uncultured Butyrivibrio sp.]